MARRLRSHFGSTSFGSRHTRDSEGVGPDEPPGRKRPQASMQASMQAPAQAALTDDIRKPGQQHHEVPQCMVDKPNASCTQAVCSQIQEQHKRDQRAPDKKRIIYQRAPDKQRITVRVVEGWEREVCQCPLGTPAMSIILPGEDKRRCFECCRPANAGARLQCFGAPGSGVILIGRANARAPRQSSAADQHNIAYFTHLADKSDASRSCPFRFA